MLSTDEANLLCKFAYDIRLVLRGRKFRSKSFHHMILRRRIFAVGFFAVWNFRLMEFSLYKILAIRIFRLTEFSLCGIFVVMFQLRVSRCNEASHK